jgi:hypothetical protein
MWKNIHILPTAGCPYDWNISGILEPRWNIWNILAIIWIEYSIARQSQILVMGLIANLSNSII